MADVVNTVLGPVEPGELGVTSVHEALLAVVPGAQYGYDIVMDRAEIFDSLHGQLTEFRDLGGGALVDSTGMFSGRDLPLYEALSRATGVHLIASTGLGPEETLGGYFLTPQTNPPTPWPAEKFADLFEREATEGMVVPRVERRAPAGLVTIVTSDSGTTATDTSLVRGGARAAHASGLPISLRSGRDTVPDLDAVLAEGLPAHRVVVGGLDRADAISAGTAVTVAELGAYVALDHLGGDTGTALDLIVDLVERGFAHRVLLSSNATGVSVGARGRPIGFGGILRDVVPALRDRGLDQSNLDQMLVSNPRDLLTVRH